MKLDVNTVEYDIDDEGKFCDGTLLFKNGNIEKYLSKRLMAKFSLDGIDKIYIFNGTGCAKVEMRKKNCTDEENISVCAISMSCLKEVSEFCKMVNFYLETGEEYEVQFDNGRCENCFRPLAPGTKECFFCTKSSDIFSRATKMFNSYYLSIIKIALILLLATTMTILTPLVQGRLVDKYLTNLDSHSFSGAANGILISVGLITVLYLLGIVLGSIASVITAKTGSAFSHDLRCKLFEKIQNMSVSSVSKHTTGELIHRITRDTEFVMNFFVGDASSLLEKTASFLVTLIILFVTNYKLALLVVIPIPIAVFLFAKTNSAMRKNNALLWRAGAKETSVLNDVIKGIRVVKSFGNEKQEIEKYKQVSEGFRKMSVVNGRFWALFVEPVSFLLSFGEILVLIVGGKMVLDGKMTLGSFISFNLYLGYLYSPLRWMSGLPRRTSQAITSLVKIFDILDEETDVCDSEKSIANIDKGDIVFDNVTFGYKSYEPILKNINLHIKQGEMIGLVGHSGAGKSTMINLVIRLFDPDSGTISLAGTNLRNYEQNSYRKKIGVVYQDTYLFSGTIFENIKYSQESASCAQVINAAKIANAHDFIMKLPDGYDTVIGENGYRLSGGERQRVAIARAVLRNPDILILDEATSALDPETEEMIQEALGRLAKGRTTIAIAHRLSTLRNADRIVVIENGEIAQQGSHVELLRSRGIYYDLVMQQRQMSKKQ